MTTRTQSNLAKEVILQILDDIAKSTSMIISSWNRKPNLYDLAGMKIVNNVVDCSKGVTLDFLFAAIRSNDVCHLDTEHCSGFSKKSQVQHQLSSLVKEGFVQAKTMPNQGRRLYYSRANILNLYSKFKNNA